MEEQELLLDFESSKVLRGDKEVLSLEELLFLLGSAVKYNSMFPVEESQKFISELREIVGTGFTPEQFTEIKEMMGDN